jgi:nucleoside-diphosphate-sugar epimerase
LNVLITGNLGYVGPVLVKFVKASYPHYNISGLDTAFFSHIVSDLDASPDIGISTQYYSDIRDFNHEILEGVDAIVHLASISNDPMGKEFEAVTSEINCDASVRLAQLAASAGVKNFVFASSCSVYGDASESAKTELDQTNPLTAYAKSKVATEDVLRSTDLRGMVFTSLRFATACGWSPRLRLDLVLNDFVACAITSKEIKVLSDGTPWRPLIDVEDMSRAIVWAMTRKGENGGHFLVVNVGNSKSNFQVKDLANLVSELIPGTTVSINKDATSDKRSYTVDFALFESLAPDFQAKISIEESVKRLRDGLRRNKFTDPAFKTSQFIRLNSLRDHITRFRLDNSLRWLGAEDSTQSV